MYPGVVQRIVALRDFQKAGALLKGLGTHAAHLHQLLAAGDFPMLVTIGHNLFGQGAVDAGNVFQKGIGCGVEVHANIVYHGAHNLVQHLGEPLLVHVMLVEAHSDGLGVDFHQLRQGVLQAAADGDGSTDGQIQLREFFTGNVAGRIDGGSVLVHYGVQHLREVFADDFGHNLLNLPCSRTVAHGHQLDIVLEDGLADGGSCGVGGAHLLDDKVPQKLAGFVQGGALGSSADSWVNTQHTGSLDGLLHQQVFQVFAEDADSVAVRIIALVTTDFPQDGGGQEANQSVLDGLAVVAVVDGVLVLQHLDGSVHVHVQAHLQLALPLTTVDGQDAVGLYLVQSLLVVPVHLVDGNLGLFLATNSLHHNLSGTQVEAPHIGTVLAVLGGTLRQDVLGSRQCVGNSCHGKLWIFRILHYKFGGLGLQCGLVQLEHGICQRIQSFFNGNHSTSLLLFLEGSPQILQLRQRLGGHDGLVEGFGQFILGENSPHNLKAAGLQI